MEMRTHTGMWLLSAAVMLGLSGLVGCSGDKGNEYRAFDKDKDKAHALQAKKDQNLFSERALN